jgi:hypothetical protein
MLLADAMLQVLDATAAERREMGLQGRSHVEQQYDTGPVESLWREQVETWEARIESERPKHASSLV